MMRRAPKKAAARARKSKSTRVQQVAEDLAA
jgi:hypothetical protein